MQDVSDSQGRTVLFVSHNMDAIQRLCSHCLMMERGKLIAQEETNTAIQKYISSGSYQATPNEWIDLLNVSRMGTGKARFIAVKYSSLNQDISFHPYSTGPLEFLLKIESDSARTVGSLSITIYNQSGTILINTDSCFLDRTIELKQGGNLLKVRIENLYLNPGIYIVGLWMDKTGTSSGRDAFDYVESAFEIEVVNQTSEGLNWQEAGPINCKFNILNMT
jgi:lipopolysaccharide transport system ATP-binding protein